MHARIHMYMHIHVYAHKRICTYMHSVYLSAPGCTRESSPRTNCHMCNTSTYERSHVCMCIVTQVHLRTPTSYRELIHVHAYTCKHVSTYEVQTYYLCKCVFQVGSCEHTEANCSSDSDLLLCIESN